MVIDAELIACHILSNSATMNIWYYVVEMFVGRDMSWNVDDVVP